MVNKMYFHISCLILILGSLSCVLCYPFGAPSSVCFSMTPSKIKHHGAISQVGECPFKIGTSKSYYKANGTIHVTIESQGADRIKGLLIQARPIGSDDIIGQFSIPPDGLKYSSCLSNDKGSVTHSERGDFQNISLVWAAPSDIRNMGNITFVATFVKNTTIFWVKEESQQLYNYDESQTTRHPTTAQPTSNTTSPSTSNTTSPSKPTNATCSGEKCGTAHIFVPKLLHMIPTIILLLTAKLL